MSNQQPRPAWFRLSSLAGRAPAPPPAPAPAPARPPVPATAPLRPPGPGSAVVRPPIPTLARPAAPPPQTPAAAPPPPRPAAAAPPPPPPPPPSPPSSTPPRSPVASRPSPPAAPQSRAPASPQRSPPLPAAAAPPPRQPSPPAAPVSATKSPIQRSPVQKEASIVSSYAPPPSPPKTKTESPPPPSPPPPPPPAQSSAMPTSPANGRAAASVPSPKVVKPMEKTPAQSPKIKPASHPPSPFTLPPAQVTADDEPDTKIDQKNVLVQQSIDKPMNKHRSHNGAAIPSNARREPPSKEKSLSKKGYDSEEGGMRMITLAGENKGAVMELSPSHKKGYNFAGNPHTLQKHQGTKSGMSNGEQLSSKNDDGKSSSKKDKANRSTTMPSPMKANLNSNVQGLNNSILFNCTFRSNDPGIHLSLTRKANGGGRTGAMDK